MTNRKAGITNGKAGITKEIKEIKMWHMFGDYGYLDGGWGIFWGVFMMMIPIIFLLFLTWIIYVAVAKNGGGSSKKADDSMQIVKERYARGEITKEQFEEIVKTLKK